MFSALVSLAGASAFGITIYKWVDEKGVTHYSDQPHPNAKMVELKSAQTYQTDGSSASQPPAESANTRPNSGPPYSICEMYRPENDEVFLNTATITVKLRVDPDLRMGDRVSLALDGKRLTNQPPTGRDFILTDVVRGTHSLNAVIEDVTGTPVCASSTVTFHVRQPSTQAPNRANRPRF